MRFGAHHEWGTLREAVVGRAPLDDIVLPAEEPRWMPPPLAALARAQAGRPLAAVDPAWARRCEVQFDALAERLAAEGVVVHRPDRLEGEERTFLAPGGGGRQMFVRDPLVVVGDLLAEAAPRSPCRQRDRFGLRASVRLVDARGARWMAVPAGSPNGVDGPYLEGGDVLLNGREVYVGMSGCASDLAGLDWLQARLGTDYRVIPVAMRSAVLHLEDCLALVRPGLVVACPDRLIDGLPMSLRDWDLVTVTAAEAAALVTNMLVLSPGRVIVEAGSDRLAGDLRHRGVEVIALPFDGPVGLGGGLRSAHQPLLRESLPG